MPRIRSIHPGLWTDEAFMELSVWARLLLIGLWTEAKDDGVIEWKPISIKVRLLPADAVEVAPLLEELERLNFLRRFVDEATGKAYAAIRNFRRYQSPGRPNTSGVLPDDLRFYVGLPARDESPPPEPSKAVNGAEPEAPETRNSRAIHEHVSEVFQTGHGGIGVGVGKEDSTLRVESDWTTTTRASAREDDDTNVVSLSGLRPRETPLVEEGLQDRLRVVEERFSVAPAQVSRIRTSIARLDPERAIAYLDRCLEHGPAPPRAKAPRPKPEPKPPPEPVAAAPPRQVFVVEDTPAWAAWKATKPRGYPTTEHEHQRGWWFPSQYPPPQEARA